MKYRSIRGKNVRLMRKKAEERESAIKWMETIKELIDKHASEGKLNV